MPNYNHGGSKKIEAASRGFPGMTELLNKFDNGKEIETVISEEDILSAARKVLLGLKQVGSAQLLKDSHCD